MFLRIIYIIVLSLFIGCGGGSNDEKSDNNITEDLNSSNLEIERKPFLIESIHCLNPENLEAGRTIIVSSKITSEEDALLTVAYYITDEDDAEYEESILLDSTVLSVKEGTFDYESSFILPSDLETGKYNIIGFLLPEEGTVLDEREDPLSEEEVENYARLYVEGTELLDIKANDGKPDLELVSIEVNSKNISEENLEKGLTSQEKTTDTTARLTFDIGIVDGNVILNNRKNIFHGSIDVQAYIADANEIVTSACLELDDRCESLEFYQLNSENEVSNKEHLIIEDIKFKERKTILFDIYISEDLLKRIAKSVLGDEDSSIKLKVALSGVEQSSTEDVDKNSIELPIEFEPIILSRSNVDNTNDVLAQALPDYQLRIEDYFRELDKLNPHMNVAEDFTPVDVSEVSSSDPVVIQPPSTVLTPVAGTLLTPASLDNLNIERFRIDEATIVHPVLEPVEITPVELSDLALGADIVAPIGALDLREEEEDYSEIPTDASKLFKENFVYGVMGDYFGIAMNLEAYAQFDNSGIEGVGEGTVDVKLLGLLLHPLSVNAYAGIKPESFEDTRYNLELEVMESVVYSQRESISSRYHLSSSTADEMGERISENIAEVAGLGEEPLFEYRERQYKVWKETSTQTIFVGPVPLTFEGYVSGELGLELNVLIPNMTSLSSNARPYTNLNAGGSASVGISGFGGGVEGRLRLVEESFIAESLGSIHFIENQAEDRVLVLAGTLEEKITNRISGPSGEINLYGEYPYAKICHTRWGHLPYPCGGGIKRKRLNIANFESGTSTQELLNQRQTLFQVRLP